LVIRGAEVDGRAVDVRIDAGRITAMSPAAGGRPQADAGADVFDARGGALLPGLHDHHIHLLALAAARRSVAVGPADVRDAEGFAAALRTADAALEPGRWLRAVGYHESVSGDLDRHALDTLVPDRPVRLQHRGGAMWLLNSAAVAAVGRTGLPGGVELAADGHPTGRLFGLDAWLGERVPREPLDLGPVGRTLLDHGVTGITDATPTDRSEDMVVLAAGVADGSLPQLVVVTGGLDLDPAAGSELERGPVKLVVADHALPALDRLAGAIATAHRRRRPVAIHCVTRVGLLLALAAWDEAGRLTGDRIEHGAVVHPAEAARIAAHGLTVVTQPAFVAERGDDYLADVDTDDRPHLWPCAGLLRAGIPVGGSTDAPFGPSDPWRAIAAAMTRRTPAGNILGADERLDARRALDLFLGPPAAPGGPPRRIVPGGPADLCLLAAPLEEAVRAPSATMVAATVRAGRLTTPARS
jgi:predicted amidohydrolase YtcJ